MARVFRQQYTKPIPADAQRTTVKDKKGNDLPAVRFKGDDGKWITAPIVQRGKTAGTHCRVHSPRWYGWLNGAAVPLCTNRSAAESMLQQRIDAALRGEAGQANVFDKHLRCPISEHLADFLRYLDGKGKDNPRYVEMVGSRLEAVFTGCEFRTLRDLDASKAADWLAQQRHIQMDRPSDPGSPDVDALPARKSRPALPAGWSLPCVAGLLGVKLKSVAPLVLRHGLVAHGNGRNRRLPRETVEALLALRKPGISTATTNQYAMHLKVFGNWLSKPGKNQRMGTNPFLDLEAGNEDADRRHMRRELTAEELPLLLKTTRASECVFRGLDGEDRYVLYAAACATGFRAGGLASLTPECFDLDGHTPTVTLPVRSDKARRGKIQPLPADVAELLRGWLADKPAGVPVWPGKWARQRSAAMMLRKDLKAAGIRFVVQGPDGPLYADFHALRHTYLTLGGRAGIDLRTLQELAGHSTSDLTERYTHVRLLDLAGAVEKMPSILPKAECQPVQLPATGTEGGPTLTGAYSILTGAIDSDGGREGN